MQFEVTDEGVFIEQIDGTRKRTRICARLDIVAATRGTNWGLLLEWKDPDGKIHSWAMPQSLFTSGDRVVLSELRAGGLQILLRYQNSVITSGMA